MLAVDGSLILLPVCRTLVRWLRPKVKFLPLDENLWFHRQVAYAMLVFTMVHVAAHYVKYAKLISPPPAPIVRLNVFTAFSTSRRLKSDQKPQSRFTTPSLVVSRVTSCCSAC